MHYESKFTKETHLNILKLQPKKNPKKQYFILVILLVEALNIKVAALPIGAGVREGGGPVTGIANGAGDPVLVGAAPGKG